MTNITVIERFNGELDSTQIRRSQDDRPIVNVRLPAFPRVSGRRIKVVECIDSFGAGGTELNLVRTIERIDRSRFDLSIVTLNDEGALRDRVGRLGLPVKAFSFPRLNSFAALDQAARVVHWLRRTQPDVVHSHDRYTNLFVTPCARLAGVPLIITSRRWWTAMPHWIYGKGNNAAYRMSHRIIANSARVARLMSDREGIPAARIVTLPNFLDDEAFEALPNEARLLARRSFGIPDDAIVVTAVAVLRPEKDLVTLIEAMALLVKDHAELHLLLVGSGPCEAALKRAVAAHHVEHRVHFTGFLSSPPSPHQFGDISVLCSLHEGFPNSIIEAMAAGKPVVATDVGGIPDAVEDGRTGLLVPPRSSERLAAGISRLVASPALRKAFGDAGLAKARGAYRAAAVLARLEALYAESLSIKA